MRLFAGTGITALTLALAVVFATALLLAPPTAIAPAQTPPPSLRPAGPPQLRNLFILSGSLHDHTTDSDGDTASADVATWWSLNHQAIGIDFATFSDHSDFFPATYGTTTPNPWTRQAALIAQYSGPGFTILRGFELTNDQENHLNVIDSQNWTGRFETLEPTLTMTPFWDWLGADPMTDLTGDGLGYGGGDGVGQFNHPGDKGALNWDDYALNSGVLDKMALIEVHGDQSRAGMGTSDAGWYWFALSQGWNVSPVMNWDWHPYTASGVVTNPNPGSNCGVAGFLPCQRSLVLAESNSHDAIIAALKLHRTSATELPDLWATLRTRDGFWQGSTVKGMPGAPLRLQLDAGSSTVPLTRVDIVSDNGVSPYPYYYGDNAPCSVDGCDPEQVDHAQLTPSYVEQHRRYVVSNGHATRKARIDSPPSNTVIASVPLSGNRASRPITVAIPAGPSPRPRSSLLLRDCLRGKRPRLDRSDPHRRHRAPRDLVRGRYACSRRSFIRREFAAAILESTASGEQLR